MRNNNLETFCEYCERNILSSSFVLHSFQCGPENKNINSVQHKFKSHFFSDYEEINNISKSANKSDYTGSNAYEFFPSIANNQVSPKAKNEFRLMPKSTKDTNEEEINVNNNFANFNKLNSFMLINNKSISANDNNLIDFNHISSNENKDVSLEKINLDRNSDEKLCIVCYKVFHNKINYELHVRNCLSEEEAFQWEDFENNAGNLDYQAQDLELEEAQNEDQLDYEDLIELDENITHPLSDSYLSMLYEECLTSASFANLSGENKKCMICFDDFEINQNLIRLPCLHLFHSSEITKWFKRNKTCPVCRFDIEGMLKSISNNNYI